MNVKRVYVKHCLAAATAALLTSPLVALDGEPGMHDPSTVVVQDGKYYAYGTGNGLPISISDDGWTWRRAGSLRRATASRSAARGSSMRPFYQQSRLAQQSSPRAPR